MPSTASCKPRGSTACPPRAAPASRTKSSRSTGSGIGIVDLQHLPKLRDREGVIRKRFLFVAIDRCHAGCTWLSRTTRPRPVQWPSSRTPSKPSPFRSRTSSPTEARASQQTVPVHLPGARGQSRHSARPPTTIPDARRPRRSAERRLRSRHHRERCQSATGSIRTRRRSMLDHLGEAQAARRLMVTRSRTVTASARNAPPDRAAGGRHDRTGDQRWRSSTRCSGREAARSRDGKAAFSSCGPARAR